MSVPSNLVVKSCLKTILACLVLAAAGLLFTWLGPRVTSNALGSMVAALGGIIACAGALLATASAVVLLRCRRDARGEPDLFLELNRSREAGPLQAAGGARRARLRRWLTRRLLGHELLVGDRVQVKSWPEIQATLDERGCLEDLPFMPEMLARCGQSAVVFRCVHRIFDYRKSRRMRHMDGAVLLTGAVCGGSAHGACEAACHTIWKAAWLCRVEPGEAVAARAAAATVAPVPQNAVVLNFGTQGPRYACQLTQLHAASRPIGKWSAANFLRPLLSRNVAPAAFVVGWLTHLFNELQHLRQGVGYPEFEPPAPDGSRSEPPPLAAGDQVIVRSSAEVRATLNEQSLHRGLYFEPDMLKHCGQRYFVQAEVRRLIDIVTGEMRTMKTPAYILDDIRFSGERQLFNAQHEPLLWRAAWLSRVADVPRKAPCA